MLMHRQTWASIVCPFHDVVLQCSGWGRFMDGVSPLPFTPPIPCGPMWISRPEGDGPAGS